MRGPDRDGLGFVAVLLCVVAGVAGSARGEEPETDVWSPIRFMVGQWEGTTTGEPGRGTVRRSYEFVIKGRYLHERNVSAYPPQSANKTGEVHEHWSFFSYDRQRKTLVLRQFHQEGFVNQYVMSGRDGSPGKLVFIAERFENVGEGWSARETYEVRSPDTFTETFELGAPGEELKVYSRNEFKRVK